jgi:glutamyl-tRNA synthetase
VVGAVDDVVLQRNDGVPAYNLAVVVDDAAQEVTDVVRGDDLMPTTPRQLLLQQLLGLPTPRYAHVPLVLGPDGERLAKRHGASVYEVGPATLALLGESLGLCRRADEVQLDELSDRFHLAAIQRSPWQIGATDL